MSFSFKKGIVPATISSAISSRGGASRGRGGGRGGNRRQQNHTEISESERNKVKQYKQKYEKYLQLRPTTNSPFDILVKAAQVIYNPQKGNDFILIFL